MTFSRRSLLMLGLACLLFFCGRPVHAQELVDSDHDGLPDIWEEKVFGTDPHSADTDGDKVSDRDEIIRGTNPLGKGNWKVKDTDGDGLNDRMELLFGTDPLVADTDGDGYSDGAEVQADYSPTSTDPTPLQKSIRIILSKQQLERREAGIAIATYKVSTGKPSTPTPVGNYQVLNKLPKAWSNLAGLWMPYWMSFTTRGHGIHELPIWPSGIQEGAAHLGRPVSHGCVRLSVAAAKEVYNWTPVGTPVFVVR